METRKKTNEKASLFSGLFHPQEAPPPAPSRAPAHATAPAPAEQKPAVSPEQVAELERKVAALEHAARRAEEAAAERLQAPPPPPPPPKDKRLESKLTKLEAKILALEETAARREVQSLSSSLSSLQIRLATVEEAAGKLLGEMSALVSVSLAPVEGRLQSLEGGLVNELKERFAAIDPALREAAVKSRVAQETAAGLELRVAKFEEKLSQLPYLESRVNSSEEKAGCIYDIEAQNRSLGLRLEKMERDMHSVMREASAVMVENKRKGSELDSLAHKVSQMSALFNHFRSELAFLVPKGRESGGG
jgi:hypothetical protein